MKKFQIIDLNQSNLSNLSIIKKVLSEEDRLSDEKHKQTVKAFCLSDAAADGIANDYAFVKKIPHIIKQIIEDKLWECLYVAKGVVTPYYCHYTKGTDSENFRAFITTKRPNGLGTTIDEIDNLLNQDPEVQQQFRALVFEKDKGSNSSQQENVLSYILIIQSHRLPVLKEAIAAYNETGPPTPWEISESQRFPIGKITASRCLLLADQDPPLDWDVEIEERITGKRYCHECLEEGFFKRLPMQNKSNFCTKHREKNPERIEKKKTKNLENQT